MKKKIVLIAALAIALILPFAISVEQADADAILFPWIVKSTGNGATLVSVVNTAEGDAALDDQLHWQYIFKDDDIDQDTECERISRKIPTSKDDLVTIDAAGIVNDGQPLYDDPGAGGTSYGGLNFSLKAQGNPARAFLIVDNNTPAFTTDGTNVDGTLYGEAIVLELSNGAAWGYIAYNASGGETTSQNGAVLFNDGVDLLGEVIGTTEVTQTVYGPTDIWTTTMFMTPANSTDQRDVLNDTDGYVDTEAEVTVCIKPNHNTGVCGETGIFDNDENPIDGGIPKMIRCTAGDTLEAFMGSALYDEFALTGRSGWSYIVTSDTVGGNDADGVMIGKLEYGVGGTAISTDTTIPDAANNFVWLRDNASIVGNYGINYIHNCKYPLPTNCDADGTN